MTQIATVEKILPGGMAEISVPRKSACGHDCEECAGWPDEHRTPEGAVGKAA